MPNLNSPEELRMAITTEEEALELLEELTATQIVLADELANIGNFLNALEDLQIPSTNSASAH